jgi:Protein of unknown function (DUF2550)
VGEALALDAAWLFAVLVIVMILAAIGIAVRRHLLERGGATVECGLRQHDGPWRLGLASYRVGELSWFRVFGVSMRPRATWPRRDLTVVSRRLPGDAEAAVLGPGRVVLDCRIGPAEAAELALSESALPGLLAWLEAAPPGSHVGRVP